MRRALLTAVVLGMVPLLYAVVLGGQVLMTIAFENDFYDRQAVVIPAGALGDPRIVHDETERWELTGVVGRPDLLRSRGWRAVRKGDTFRFVVTPVRDGVGELAVTVERTGQVRIFFYNENFEVTGEKK